MLFTGNDYVGIVIPFELKQGHKIWFHELDSDWSGHQGRKLLSAQREVLFDLHYTEKVCSALCLYRYCVVTSVTVKAYVQLIGLYLS